MKGKINKLIFVDFDYTLVKICPEMALNNPLYKNNSELNIGWWDTTAALDIRYNHIFQIESVYNDILANSRDNTKTVLLTNRPPDLKKNIITVLNHFNINLDILTFRESKTLKKCDRIEGFLVKYPEVKTVMFYDDEFGHFADCSKIIGNFPKIEFRFLLVDEDKINEV